MTEAQFIDLIRTFAETHPAIQHSEGVRERFTSMGEQIFVKLTEKLDAKNFVVVLAPEAFDTNTIDKGNSNWFDQMTFNFEVAKIAPRNNEAQTIITQQIAKTIVEDFWQEMLFYRDNRISPFEYPVGIINVSKNATQGGAENMTGYRMQLTLEVPTLGPSSGYTPFSIVENEP